MKKEKAGRESGLFHIRASSGLPCRHSRESAHSLVIPAQAGGAFQQTKVWSSSSRAV
jgi:hypothetical protein